MIVSCGEALIDFLPVTSAAGEAAYAPHAGGSPFNVALAIGRLGVSAGFFGGLSRDLFGEILRKALHESGVNTGLAHVSDRPTTLAFVSLSDGNARYAFFDEGSVGRVLTDADLPALPATVEALHFGSFSLAVEPCGSALETLMQRERDDRVISLDVNVRPGLIHNREGYLARIERLVAMCDIVKLSEEDVAWLAPGVAFADLAERWQKKGPALVVLTKGAEGAVACIRGETVTVPAVKVTVADTVAAGDTFTAGLLVRLHQKERLTKSAVADLDRDTVADLLGYAARAAAITASRPGADPPWARELA